MGRAARYGNPKTMIKVIDECTEKGQDVEKGLKDTFEPLIKMQTARSGDGSAVREGQSLEAAYSAILSYAEAKRNIIALHMGGVTANLGTILKRNGVPVDVVIRKIGGLDNLLEEKARMGASDAKGSDAKVSKKEFKVAFVKGIKEAAPNSIEEFGKQGRPESRPLFLTRLCTRLALRTPPQPSARLS